MKGSCKFDEEGGSNHLKQVKKKNSRPRHLDKFYRLIKGNKYSSWFIYAINKERMCTISNNNLYVYLFF